MYYQESASSKQFQFSCISSITREDVMEVDKLLVDGRTDAEDDGTEGLGGMGCFAVQAIRRFDSDATLAWSGLAGGRDETIVRELLNPFNVSTDYLINVPNKETNKSLVLSDGTNRLIVRRRHQIDFLDLDEAIQTKFMELVRASRVCLLSNLPLELTRKLIDFGHDESTYVALGPGSRQLMHLADLQPHMLTLNFKEGQAATGLEDCDDEQRVFAKLCDLCRFAHVGVMTGNGTRPTLVYDRISEKKCEIEPLDLNHVPGPCRLRPKCLGAGDTMAGALSFVLGQAEELAIDDKLKDVVSFAQDVVVAHMTESSTFQAQIKEKYRDLRSPAVSRSLTIGRRR